MKNENLKLYPIYLSGLVLMAVTTWLLAPLIGGVHWMFGIIGALLLCLGAVLCHVKSKQQMPLYIVGYALNAVGSGCAIGTLYAQMSWTVNIPTLALALVPAAVLGLVLCLGYFGQGKVWRAILGGVVLVLTLGMIVLAIAAWIRGDRVSGSFCFFSGLCLLFFLMACLFTLDKPVGKWRYLSFSGFWAFAVIAVVVVLILSEGDILDGLDFDFSGGGGSGKKKRRK